MTVDEAQAVLPAKTKSGRFKQQSGALGRRVIFFQPVGYDGWVSEHKYLTEALRVKVILQKITDEDRFNTEMYGRAHTRKFIVSGPIWSRELDLSNEAEKSWRRAGYTVELAAAVVK